MYELRLYETHTSERASLILTFNADSIAEAGGVLDLLDAQRASGYARAALFLVEGKEQRRFIEARTLSRDVLGYQV